MNENKINISKHTSGMLKELGLNPPDVAELTITPTTVTVTVFKRNEDGNKYLVEPVEYLPGLDAEDADVTSFATARPATETKTFDVRT